METRTAMRCILLLPIIFWCYSANPQGRAPFLGPKSQIGRGATGSAGGGGGQTINDDFNRANNADLGANWTTVTSEGSLGVSANACTFNSVGADSTERYSGVSWTANQSSEAKITAGSGSPGEGGGVAVRCASGSRDFYGLVINGDGEWELFERVGGTKSSLATGTTTYSAGAVLKLTIIGTTLTSVYNGVQIDSRSDASHATGSPGITYSSQPASFTCDDWQGVDGL